MTQTAPPPHQMATTGTPPPARKVVDTPALLNRWQVIGMSVAVVFAIASALIQLLAWESDGRAADDTEQLVRIQNIQTQLFRADALATNSFLVGGIEDPDQREAFEDTISGVLEEITAAADAQPADRDALEALAVVVKDYVTGVAQGRDYNRQQLPVGAEYLSIASDSLEVRAVPIVDNLVASNEDRVEGATSGHHPTWLLLTGLIALVLLWWVNRQMARTFRRRFNTGLLIAAAIVVAVSAVGAVAAWSGDAQNDDLRNGELAIATDQAAARTAGNIAKAQESLRLIKRGSGKLHEAPWIEADDVVRERAHPATRDEWTAYADRHGEIVALDNDDFWLRARAIALSDDAQGTTALFGAFDEVSGEVVDDNAATVVDELRGGRTVAFVGALLTLLLGGVAAGAVARGIGARRKEYA